MSTTRTPPTTRTAEPAVVALDLLAEVGPKHGGLRLVLDEVRAATGLGRSSIYRTWPSLQDLTEDVLVLLATTSADWRETVLAADADDSIGALLATTLGTTPRDLAWASRSLISTWPDHHPARQEVLQHERRTRTRLHSRTQELLRHRGLRPRDGLTSNDISVAMTALLDGVWQASTAFESPSGDPAWSWLSPEDLRRTLDHTIGEMTVAGALSEERPEIPPPPTRRIDQLSAAPRQALERIAEAVASARVGEAAIIRPTRVVDMEVLARRVGISSRRLHDRWPAPADLHADLLRASIDRHDQEVATAVDRVIGGLIDRPGADDEDLFTEAFRAMVQRGSLPAATGYYGTVFAWPGTAARQECGRAAIDARRRRGVALMALLQVRGHHVAEGFDVDRFTAALSSTVLGTQGAMRLDLDLVPTIESPSAVATGVLALVGALSEECGHAPHPHGRAVATGVAPTGRGGGS